MTPRLVVASPSTLSVALAAIFEPSRSRCPCALSLACSFTFAPMCNHATGTVGTSRRSDRIQSSSMTFHGWNLGNLPSHLIGPSLPISAESQSDRSEGAELRFLHQRTEVAVTAVGHAPHSIYIRASDRTQLIASLIVKWRYRTRKDVSRLSSSSRRPPSWRLQRRPSSTSAARAKLSDASYTGSWSRRMLPISHPWTCATAWIPTESARGASSRT